MTTPAASCPITAGNGTNLRFPSIAFKSLAHKPLAAIFTKTSPAFGESKSNSETSNWDPIPSRTAALIFNVACSFLISSSDVGILLFYMCFWRGCYVPDNETFR